MLTNLDISKLEIYKQANFVGILPKLLDPIS